MAEGKTAPTFQVQILKQMSQDEQVTMAVHADTKGVLADRLKDAFEVLDGRLVVMGQRVIDATQHVNGFPMEVRQAINACMGILFGRPGAIQELQVAKDAIEQSKRNLEAIKADEESA